MTRADGSNWERSARRADGQGPDRRCQRATLKPYWTAAPGTARMGTLVTRMARAWSRRASGRFGRSARLTA